jgi:hypothetical protein
MNTGTHDTYPHQHQHVLYNDFKKTHHAHFTFTLRMYFAISARDTHTDLTGPVEKHRGRRRHHTYVCLDIAAGRTVSRSRA